MDKDDDDMTALIADGRNEVQDASAASDNAKKKDLVWFPHYYQRRGGVHRLLSYVVLIGFGYLLCLNMERVTFSFLPRSSFASRGTTTTTTVETTTTTTTSTAPASSYTYAHATTEEQQEGEGQQQQQQQKEERAHSPPSSVVSSTVDTTGGAADGDADAGTKTTATPSNNNDDDEGNNVRNKKNKQKADGGAGMLRTGSNDKSSGSRKSNGKNTGEPQNEEKKQIDSTADPTKMATTVVKEAPVVSIKKKKSSSASTDVNKVQVATAASSKAQKDHDQKQGDQEHNQEEGNQNNNETEQEVDTQADVVADDANADANAEDASANADADAESSTPDVNKVQVAASKAQHQEHDQKEGDQEYKQEEGNQNNNETEQEDDAQADVVADDSADAADAPDTSAHAVDAGDEDFFGFAGPPLVITKEDRQPTVQPPHMLPCSCYNVTPHTVDGVKCCERNVHVNHKFGSYLMRGIFSSHGDSVYQRHGLGSAERLFVHSHEDQPSNDVRKVLMARNIFEALISGYLYHKDGHECATQPTKRSSARMYNLTVVTSPEAPDPGDRDLCQYLQDESEYDGLRMYAEWIFRLRYARYIQVFKTSLNDPEYPMHGRVRIVCFEDMTDPDAKDEELRGIINWFYPGGGYGDIPPLPKAEYVGTHATSHDPDLHKRLRKMLMRLDATEFHGQLQAAQRVFGCDKKK